MAKPTREQLLNEDTFFDFVRNGQKYNTTGGVKSTASINGGQTYAATTHTVADILQGNLTQINPEEQLLVINKGLTDSLGLLYKEGSGMHGFSTFSQTTPSVMGGGASSDSIGSVGVDGIGAVLPESYVQNLPLKHANGALIWAGRGKASEEMHLPVAEKIADDVAKHLQYTDLKPTSKHPWNMDRVGGAVGGEARIYTDVSSAETKLGESSDADGKSGAFGILDPLSEQFYCSMAWPYRGAQESFRKAGREDVALIAESLSKNDYKGKKVLVWSFETSRGVVCTPGDWGTQPYWSNGAVGRGSINGFYIGLSPDVHHALGTQHGTEVLIRWMPDDTPLGPFGSKAGAGGGIWSTITNAASGLSSAINSLTNLTVEQLKYAGNIVASHPNLKGDTFKTQLRDGLIPQVANHVLSVFKPEINRGFYYPSMLNYLWVILEAGFVLDTSNGGGGYNHRTVNFVPGARLSNHAYGAAVDIIKLGRGTAVSYTDPRWRSENDALFTMLAGLARDTKPSEVGSSFAYKYGTDGWFNVYKESNPTHLHLGFSLTQIGSFIPALKPKTTNPSGIRSPLTGRF